ncbi:MAG: DUF3320 domain-containing protein [Kiritimatiellae bacterium]|nr:DUF3320 domain-containing protein [Kiritimatiellia bacterium]
METNAGKGQLVIEETLLGKAGLVLQQNAIQLIRSLRLIWDGDRPLRKIVCRVSSDPEFFPPAELSADSLPPSVPVDFSSLQPVYQYSYLTKITERIRGNVKIEVTGVLLLDDGMEEPVSAQKSVPVEICPHDDWFGSEFMPELLAAFVMPNDSSLSPLLQRIQELLQDRYPDSKLSGYQSGSRDQVMQVLKCIYDTVLEQGIRYTEPPPSFGESGQRIRTAKEIMEKKFATCLDSTLLFAALMEACGFHPIVFLTKGHAFVGCHLLDAQFPDTRTDDVQAIRKRIDLNEICVIETTLAVVNGGRFSSAMEAAQAKLQRDEEFHFALDVEQCRKFGIRPLSSERQESGTVAPDGTANPLDADDEPLPKLDSEEEPEEPARPEEEQLPPRVRKWRSKLLDLSRRNRLLNFKDSKQAIPLICDDLPGIEDEFAAGKTFTLNPRPTQFLQNDPRAEGKQIDLTALELAFAKEEAAKCRLYSRLDQKELQNRLKELFRTSKSDLEEGGVNTLFLAVGFLNWKDGTMASSPTYQAPLLLIPVTLFRKTVQEGYSLSRNDDDTIVNVTLMEMMKHDFGLQIDGLNPPPEDESGLDVAKILTIVKEAVKTMQGWEVVDGVWLGRFSFSKFIMWDDLGRRLDDLRKSPVVNHLIENKESFDDGAAMVKPDEVDTCIPVDQLFCPMSADSSQLAAVLSAVNGKSFVLHGPPGSGKSQTITNLIAACLAAGKTVLFCAEKRAALEVVQRRLRRIGLGPFCLELHSNKAGKSEVLAQFQETLSFTGAKEPAEWESIARELGEVRTSLTTYVQTLHQPDSCGMTPYHAFSYLFTHAGDEREIRHVGAFPALKFEKDELEQLLECTRRLRVCGEELPPQLFDDLSFCRATEWSAAWEADAVAHAKEFAQSLESLKQASRSFASLLEIKDFDALDEKQIARLRELAVICKEAPEIPADLWTAWESKAAAAEKLLRAGQETAKFRAENPNIDWDAVEKLNIAELRQRWRRIEISNAIFRFFRRRSLLKELKLRCLHNPGKATLNARPVNKWIDRFESYQDVAAVVKGTSFGVPEYTFTAVPKDDQVWQSLEKLVTCAKSLWDAVKALGGKPAGLAPVLETRTERSICDAELQAIDSFCEKRTGFFTALGGSSETSAGQGTTDDAQKGTARTIRGLLKMTETVLENRSELRRWLLWNKEREAALSIGLYPVTDAIERGDLELDWTEEAVRKRYCEKVIEKVIAERPVLRDFLGNVQDEQIKRFWELDDRHASLSQQMIVAKLSARLPSARFGNCPSGTELGVLKRECEKKSRHKPVRTLLESIPTLLPNLKPCLLMSPLSVAQYLPPQHEPFDVVVFDEASQITVPDAIGVIARGKQCVIVGDPKQLPPTTFFQRQQDAGDEPVSDTDIEELESILDECKASGISETYLQWHYRSRHESLIAFSNRYYYGNRLFTFPSSQKQNEQLGVSFQFVPDGVYDRCKSRTNRVEAEAVVRAVMARLLDPAFAKKSTGVVTFSEAQQALIEDLMDDEREKHPEIEKFFSDDLEEPFFVKNLENVQGDERDAIFFSCGYAKDQNGKFAMNFGPLNRVGGERRLNVAITRAKEQVVVFASIHATDIDLGRTQATGAMHLKNFLSYAEHGVSNLGIAAGTKQESDSRLEDEVAEFLRCQGYQVEKQVGCSGYRIDVGVMSRVAPDRYAIGIECDGEYYRNASSERDRDKLRRSVLEGLGWRMYRVWSAEWWFDAERAKAKLLAEVEAAVEGKPAPSGAMPTYKAPRAAEPVAQPQPVVADEFVRPYELAKPMDYSKKQEKFNLLDAPPILDQQIRRLVAAEGPIVFSLLRKRIMQEWDFKRLKPNMEDVLLRSIPKDIRTTAQGTGEDRQLVFWPDGVTPESYTTYRIPKKDDKNTKRALDEIPVQEIANAERAIKQSLQSVPEETLYLETAKRFGFARVTATQRPIFEDAGKGLA